MDGFAKRTISELEKETKIRKGIDVGVDILSLFDGMSLAMVSSIVAELSVNRYYSSEISDSKIKLSKCNFPNIIQLGDVLSINNPPIVDVLIGGSPCQGFSINGNRLNFDDQRSKLLFEFIRIRDSILLKNKDMFWLLENVATMSKDVKQKIDELTGVVGIEINSNIVSAQNRKRIYWTNIPIDLKSDRFICKSQRIQDVLEDYFDKKLLLTVQKLDKQFFNPSETNGVITLNPKKFDGTQTYQQDRIYSCKGRFPALTASLGNRFNIRDNYGNYRRLSVREQARLQCIPDWYDLSCVSDREASEAIGDAFTVNIISRFLQEVKRIKIKKSFT